MAVKRQSPTALRKEAEAKAVKRQSPAVRQTKSLKVKLMLSHTARNTMVVLSVKPRSTVTTILLAHAPSVVH